MSLSWWWTGALGAWLAATGPADDAVPTPSPDETIAEPAAEDRPMEYLERAPIDVQTLLEGEGQTYLKARARLVEHPAEAAPALLDRMQTVPPPGPAERKRLMDVLAELRRPEHIDMFASELRRSVLAADGPTAAGRAAARWQPLLRTQGAASLGALARLVGDKKLPINVRSSLLDDLVAVTPADKTGDLVALVGRGDRTLRGQLRRAVSRRVRDDPAAGAALVASTDAAIETAGPDRIAALIQFRAVVTPDGDTGFAERLAALATDDAGRFEVRVAALRGLGRVATPNAYDAVQRVAATQLGAKRTQQSELLGWVALRNLPPKRAAKVLRATPLHADDAPRLATVAFLLGPLPADPGWLQRSQDNPWPQVRIAALARVDAPCSSETVRLAARLGGPVASEGDPDSQIARAGIQALGRCADAKAVRSLARLLKSDADLERRAEAARQLVRHGGPSGLDAVATLLASEPRRDLARRLATALRYAKAPNDRVRQALCSAQTQAPEVARAARQTAALLYKGRTVQC